MAMVTATAVVISPFSPTPVASAAGPATDDFSSGGYSGGTGWSGNWDENNDGDSPTGGNIRVVNQQLRFRGIDSNDSIERDVNLSGYSAGATLSFTIATNDGDEDLALRLGGTTVAVTPESPNGTRLSYVIPSNLLTNTTLSIVSTTDGFSSNEEIILDDIEIVDYVANPDLVASCGIDVEIILDESGSIDSQGAIPEVEAAVGAFAAGLEGTTSTLRISEFSTNGRDVELGGPLEQLGTGSTALQEVDGDLILDINAYLGGTGSTGNIKTYQPGDDTSDRLNFTNWEAGLDRSQPNNADLVIFITDGVPNTVGLNNTFADNNNGGGSDASAAAAVDEALAIRGSQTKLLGVGVGQVTEPPNLDRLEELVEPVNPETYDGTGTLNISTVDVIQVDKFDDLEQALQDVVFALCETSVSINKVDQNGAAVPGLDFTGTVDIVDEAADDVDDFEWVAPDAGLASPNNQSQTVTTSSPGGAALFQWAPGTIDDPQPWDSSFTFSESLTGDFANWTVAASQDPCTVQRLGVDDFEIDLVSEGPDQDGTVTFTLLEDDEPFIMEKGDIVACTVENNEPATITVVKDAVPDSSQDFEFSLTGSNTVEFALDDDADDNLPNSRSFDVPAGSYTVTEAITPPQGDDRWELTGLDCLVDEGEPTTVSTSLANRTATLDVNPGDAVTCTFVNRTIPGPQIAVEKSATPTSFTEPSGSVEYQVTVSNPGTEPTTLTALIDEITLRNGTAVTRDLAQADPANVTEVGGDFSANSCADLLASSAADRTIAPDGELSCSFTIDYSGRNADEWIDDTITASVVDRFGRSLNGTASAEVEVEDALPEVRVDKSNVETSTVAPGGETSWTIVVSNPDTAVEPVWIRSFSDQMQVDPAGPDSIVDVGPGLDITTVGGAVTDTNCGALIGVELAPGESSDTCTVTIDTTALPTTLFDGDQLYNKVSVFAEDDDDNEATWSSTANRPVVAADPILDVWKTDGQATISENGSNVTYTIWIDNLGLDGVNEPLTLTKLVDEIWFPGTALDGPADATITVDPTADPVVQSDLPNGVLVDTTCNSDSVMGVTLATSDGTQTSEVVGSDDPRDRPANPGSGTECTITLFLEGNAGDEFNDRVTVTAVDPDQQELTGSNAADTPVVGAPPVVRIEKTPSVASVDEPGGPVTFTFEIFNDSNEFDPITITSLSDSDFGDLLAARDDSNCDTVVPPATIPPGDSITCSLTAQISGNADDVHQNTVTVNAEDDESVPAPQAQDTAEVDFDDAAPTIEVVKTAIAVDGTTVDTPPATVPETGGAVTYQVEVVNTSVEQLFLTELDDNMFGNLAGKGTCAVTTVDDDVIIEVGETYTCTFTETVAQVAGETAHKNVVKATAEDDEGNPVSRSDDETVMFTPVPPAIEITKTDVNPDDPSDPNPSVDEAGGPMTYTITVTNPSTTGDPAVPNLEDIVEITELDDVITYVDRPADITLDLLGGPAGDMTANDCDAAAALVTAANPLEPGDSFTCSFTVQLSGTSQDVVDTVIVEGVDNDGQPADDEASESTPIRDVPAGVQIVKTASPTMIDDGDSTTYTFVISNTSAIEPIFVVGLEDSRFDDLSGLTPADACVFSIDDPVELAPMGQDGDSVTCTGTFTPVFGEAGFDDEPGTHTNVATVTAADDEILGAIGGEGGDPEFLSDFDDETVKALSDVTTAKTVNDALTVFADGVWTIVYDITVANDSVGLDTYSIVDALSYGAGTQVQTVTAEVVSNGGQADGPETADLNPAFQPDPNADLFEDKLISDVLIDGDTTHAYRVTVTATVPTPTVGAGQCDVDTGSAGGFLNTAVVTVGDEERNPDRACEPFSTLTLTKILVNDDGGEAGFDVFPMTATPSTGGDPVVDGTQTVIGAVPAGEYDLAEPSVEGYTSSGWSCSVDEDPIAVEGGTATTGSITVGEAADVTCEITNDDDPVDLELTKNDGGATAVAGGPAFPYTITVDNVGTRAVDASEVYVTVVDILPDGFEWVSFPDDALEFPRCAVDGTDPSVLRCDLLPSSLGVGQQVVLETTVKALPDTPGGTYTNVAWVTIDDDPVCDPQAQDCDPTCEDSCTPPPCPDGDVPGSNVGCDDTPVVYEGALEIVKVDDVDFTVVNGDTFSYDLSVSNTGPSPITDVVVTDDLPDGLTLDSVSANPAHWTCNDSDPISCTYNTPLAAGPAASSITVTVTVDDDAIFADDTIVNVAVANGDLDDEPLPPVDDDEETPLERTLNVKLLTTDCLKDAPYINYEIDALGFVPTGDITFRLYDADDNLVDTIVQSSLTGRFVYPGAAVDGDGNGTDWPGWKLEDGVWVLDDSDAILRDGLRVEVEVNPSVTTSVEYPPASSACASPSQTSADLSIEKTASVAVVAVGDGTGAKTFDWTLDVANAGPDPAVDVVVQDIIPSVLTVTGVSSEYFDCATSGQTVTCTRDTMPVGGAGSITISVSLPGNAVAGPIENVGTVESNVPDPDLSNNSDDAVVDVVSQEPPVTQVPPPVTLPPTGSNGTSPMIQIGLLLLAIGAVGVLGARRRRGIAG